MTYEEQLAKLEQATVKAVASPFTALLRQVLSHLVAVWPGDDASPEAKESALDSVPLGIFMRASSFVALTLQEVAQTALDLGLEAGSGMAGLRVRAFKQALDPDTLAMVQSVITRMQQNIDKYESMVLKAQTLDEAIAATMLANPVNIVKRNTTNIVHGQANAGIQDVARSSPTLVSVWVAERDACVQCLAYQGKIDTGKGFPQDLSFGKAKPTGPIDQPPLHLNCRCTLLVLDADVAGGVATGLEREAKRSILRGYSRPSESETVRLDAARKLLKTPNGLPKSVQQYAREAIKHGEFKHGRTPPS